MSEKGNKFILGDNSDGYRRSADSEKTKPIFLPPQPVQRPEVQRKPPARPSQRPGAQRVRAPQQGQRPVKPNTRSAQMPQRPAQRSKQPQRGQRPAQPPQDNRALSPNERRKLHNELRRKQRRRKQLMSYAVVCVLVLAVAVALSLTVFFQVNEIVVKGESPYTKEQIIKESGITLGENVIRCNVDAVSGKLAKALPYIGSAAVERSLSGTVTITVKATKAKWSVINGEAAIMIDASGKVLEVAAAEKALDAIIVKGVTPNTAVPGEAITFGDGASFDLVKKIGDAADAAGINELTWLDVIDVDYITALYDERLTIIIGSIDNIEKKLALTARAIERENDVDPDQYATLDLTIDGKLYLKPEQPAESMEPDETTEPNSDVA